MCELRGSAHMSCEAVRVMVHVGVRDRLNVHQVVGVDDRVIGNRKKQNCQIRL